MTQPSVATWEAYATLSTLVSGAGRPDGVHRGEGWFAALSHAPSAELNLCGLDPRATAAGVAELVAALGPDLPAVVFTSAAVPGDVRGVLLDAGFETASVPEPLMRCDRPPAPVASHTFRVAPATEAHEVDAALALTAEAHRIDRALIAATIGAAAAHGLAQPWLAWDGDEAVSTVWLVAQDGFVGVREMMTPTRHQRRGAGRCLLAAALAATWTPATEHALLLSTPAGRRLYASLGFHVADEVVTCYRGLEDDVKAAIGQAPG